MAIVGKGRPFPTHTPLGKVMAKRGLRKYQVAGAAGISDRQLTEYLAGRASFSIEHLAKLCRVLKVDPEVLLGEHSNNGRRRVHDHPVPRRR